MLTSCDRALFDSARQRANCKPSFDLIHHSSSGVTRRNVCVSLGECAATFRISLRTGVPEYHCFRIRRNGVILEHVVAGNLAQCSGAPAKSSTRRRWRKT
jgi:hypothetical protein